MPVEEQPTLPPDVEEVSSTATRQYYRVIDTNSNSDGYFFSNDKTTRRHLGIRQLADINHHIECFARFSPFLSCTSDAAWPIWEANRRVDKSVSESAVRLLIVDLRESNDLSEPRQVIDVANNLEKCKLSVLSERFARSASEVLVPGFIQPSEITATIWYTDVMNFKPSFLQVYKHDGSKKFISYYDWRDATRTSFKATPDAITQLAKFVANIYLARSWTPRPTSAVQDLARDLLHSWDGQADAVDELNLRLSLYNVWVPAITNAKKRLSKFTKPSKKVHRSRMSTAGTGERTSNSLDIDRIFDEVSKGIGRLRINNAPETSQGF